MALLDGQVCLVTGAGQGLGRAIALEIAHEGARVVLLERNPDTLATVLSEIEEKGGQADTSAKRDEGDKGNKGDQGDDGRYGGCMR